MDARQAAIAAYEARKTELEAEARDDEKSRRPIRAAHKRQAARRLTLAIVSEELDSLPTGIVNEVSDVQQRDHENREGQWP